MNSGSPSPARLCGGRIRRASVARAGVRRRSRGKGTKSAEGRPSDASGTY